MLIVILKNNRRTARVILIYSFLFIITSNKLDYVLDPGTAELHPLACSELTLSRHLVLVERTRQDLAVRKSQLALTFLLAVPELTYVAHQIPS